MATRERLERATEGLRFTLKKHHEGELVVGPKCGENSGRWCCATHHEAFDNQMQKDFHIGRGRHVLVWWCYQHGPEVP